MHDATETATEVAPDAQAYASPEARPAEDGPTMAEVRGARAALNEHNEQCWAFANDSEARTINGIRQAVAGGYYGGLTAPGFAEYVLANRLPISVPTREQLAELATNIVIHKAPAKDVLRSIAATYHGAHLFDFAGFDERLLAMRFKLTLMHVHRDVKAGRAAAVRVLNQPFGAINSDPNGPAKHWAQCYLETYGDQD